MPLPFGVIRRRRQSKAQQEENKDDSDSYSSDECWERDVDTSGFLSLLAATAPAVLAGLDDEPEDSFEYCSPVPPPVPPYYGIDYDNSDERSGSLQFCLEETMKLQDRVDYLVNDSDEFRKLKELLRMSQMCTGVGARQVLHRCVRSRAYEFEVNQDDEAQMHTRKDTLFLGLNPFSRRNSSPSRLIQRRGASRVWSDAELQELECQLRERSSIAQKRGPHKSTPTKYTNSFFRNPLSMGFGRRRSSTESRGPEDNKSSWRMGYRFGRRQHDDEDRVEAAAEAMDLSERSMGCSSRRTPLKATPTKDTMITWRDTLAVGFGETSLSNDIDRLSCAVQDDGDALLSTCHQRQRRRASLGAFENFNESFSAPSKDMVMTWTDTLGENSVGRMDGFRRGVVGSRQRRRTSLGSTQNTSISSSDAFAKDSLLGNCSYSGGNSSHFGGSRQGVVGNRQRRRSSLSYIPSAGASNFEAPTKDSLLSWRDCLPVSCGMNSFRDANSVRANPYGYSGGDYGYSSGDYYGYSQGGNQEWNNSFGGSQEWNHSTEAHREPGQRRRPSFKGGTNKKTRRASFASTTSHNLADSMSAIDKMSAAGSDSLQELSLSMSCLGKGHQASFSHDSPHAVNDFVDSMLEDDSMNRSLRLSSLDLSRSEIMPRTA